MSTIFSLSSPTEQARASAQELLSALKSMSLDERRDFLGPCFGYNEVEVKFPLLCKDLARMGARYVPIYLVAEKIVEQLDKRGWVLETDDSNIDNAIEEIQSYLTEALEEFGFVLN